MTIGGKANLVSKSHDRRCPRCMKVHMRGGEPCLFGDKDEKPERSPFWDELYGSSHRSGEDLTDLDF